MSDKLKTISNLFEGNETVTNCDTFKLEAKDGKMRATDVLDTEGIFRL